jgi:hypothetical protein
MHGVNLNDMADFSVTACRNLLAGGAAGVQMNPLNDGMNGLQPQVSREQRHGLPDLEALMNEMLNALHQMPDETAHVDMGGRDTRPGDLAAHFDPKMDQDINLYTGGGDDMVIIV